MKLPTLKNTEEALCFGRTATSQQRTALYRLQQVFLARSDKAIAHGNHREALDLAVKAQLCREAWEKGEMEL